MRQPIVPVCLLAFKVFGRVGEFAEGPGWYHDVAALAAARTARHDDRNHVVSESDPWLSFAPTSSTSPAACTPDGTPGAAALGMSSRLHSQRLLLPGDVDVDDLLHVAVWLE